MMPSSSTKHPILRKRPLLTASVDAKDDSAEGRSGFSGAIIASEEPPLRRARRDVMSTQVETLQAELEHERSLRTLDERRFQQAKQRLERQVEFAVEEAREAKTLMEDIQEESERHVQQLRQRQVEYQRELQDLRERILQDEDELGARSVVEHEDHAIQLLEDRLQARETENEGLKDTIQQLKDQLQKTTENYKELQSTAGEEQAVLGMSPAPPDVVKELNRVRIQLAETERKNRQLKRASEELPKAAKQLVRQQELNRSSTARISQLERLVKERDQTVEARNAELAAWKQFGNSVHEILPKKYNRAATSAADNVPPEVVVVKRYLQEGTKQVADLQGQIQQLKKQLEAAQDKAQAMERAGREMEQSKKSLDKQLQDTEKKVQRGEKQIQVLQGQESVWKREVESLRSIIKTFDELPLPNKPQASGAQPDATVRVLETSLDATKQELSVLKKSQDSLQAELNAAVAEKDQLQKTHNTVLSKFDKLKEAVYADRAKAEKAEARAIEAESLAGKGSFNPETTRVLHLQQNPLTEALKQEVSVLKRQVEVLSSNSNSGDAKKNKSSTSAALDFDPDKLHQRLKQSFKEQIGRFREGVYLMTGFKIDMIPEGDRPKFKVRSMFGERETDHLMFQWPEGKTVDSLDLLDTEFAKLLTTTPSYQYVQRFHSLPAFLASTQLSLFEKQTMM